MRVDEVGVESYGVSDIGYVRSNNEDAWAQLDELQFFVLADGMGGHKAGEVASREAVQKLCKAVTKLAESTEQPTAAERARQLQKTITEVNRDVYLLSQKNENYAGMGTTLACFWLYQKNLILAHVGDSRIYRLRKKSLTQLTLDHSLRQELLVKGELNDSSAAVFAYKNVITRAIGTQPQVEPDIDTLKVSLDDIYFICSDGLTDELKFEEIRAVLLKAKTIKEASDNLVAAAKKKGGSDNITVVMIKIVEKNLSR